MEVRLGDATANPYLGMAAIGAAVHLGVRDRLEPPAPLEGYGYDPSSAPMLPQSLPQALEALETDTEFTKTIGMEFVEAFLSYKRNEIQRFSRHVTDWEFREYAYHL
jgi:glutamine synthetase